MNLFAVGKPVKSFGHEMAPATFFEKLAFVDFNTAIARHLVVSELNGTVTAWIVQFLVPVASHTVELQQPVFESFINRALA